MNSRGMMNGCTQAPGGNGSGGPNGMYMNGMQPYMYDPNGMDQSQMSMPFTHYGNMMSSSGLASMDGSGYGHHFFGGMAQQQQQMLLQQQHQNMAASVYGSMGNSFSMPGSDQMSMANHYQSGVSMGHYLNGGSSSYSHYPQQQQQQQQQPQIPPSVRPTPTPQPNPQEIADSIYHMASSAYRAPVAPPGSRSAQHQAQLPPQSQQQSQSQQPLQQATHHQQQQQAHSMSAAPMTPLGSGGGHAASNGGAGATVNSMVSMPGCYSPGPPYGRPSGMLSPAMSVTQQPPRAAGAPGSSSSSSSHPSPTAAGGTSGPMSPLSIRSPPLSAVPSAHSAGGGNLAGQLSPGSVQSASSPGLTPPPHHLHRSSPSGSHLLALHGASPSSSSGMATATGSMYGQGVVRPQHASVPRLHAQQMGAPGQMVGSESGVMVPSGSMFGNPLQSLERLAQITDKYPVDPKSIVSGSSMHDSMSLYHHQSPMAQQQLPVHLQQQQQSSAAHSYAMYGMQQPGTGSHYQSAVGSGYANAMPLHLQSAGEYAKLEPAERPKTSASQGKKSGSSKASSHAASSSGGKGKSAGAGKKPGAGGKAAAQSPQAGEDTVVSRKVADESGSGAGQPPVGGSGSNSFQPSTLGVASSTAGGEGRARAVHGTTDTANIGLVATAAVTEASNIAGANSSSSPAECNLQSLLSVPPGRSPPHYHLHPQKKLADVGGSAAGLTTASPKAPVLPSPAATADEAQLGPSAGAVAQSLLSSRDKEDGPQRILSPTRLPQSPATVDLASAASAGSGSSSSSSADSVGSGLREDRCALEAEADGMLLSHETCASASSPLVGDANGYKKASGSSARGGDESGRADVDTDRSHDSEHTDLTPAATSSGRDSSDCAKQQQYSATVRREEPRGGSSAAAVATLPLDSADGTNASAAAVTGARHRSASSSVPPDPFSADVSGSSAVTSSLQASVSAVGASAAAPAAGGLSVAARGTLLTGIFGTASAGPDAAAAAAASATAAGIDYSNCKNVPLRKRKPGLPPSADASTRACGPMAALSSQVLPPLQPPLLLRDPAAPVTKKPRALGLKKPSSFSIVASDGNSSSSGSGRSTVTLSPSVLAAAAAAHRTPERGEPPPPHLEKAVNTPVKAEYPERKDSRASGGSLATALSPSPGSAAADTFGAGTTSPPLREQRRRRSSSSSDASPAATLVSQRRPAAVAALSLLAAESRNGSGVASAKSDVAPSVPLSGLRSLMQGSMLPVKSSAVTPSSMEATSGSALLGGCSSASSTTTDAATALPPPADGTPTVQPEVVKRKRGRPLGSKNKKKDGLSYKPTKKDRAKPGTTSKRSAAAVAAAAIASLESAGRAGRTSAAAAAGYAASASHSAVAGQQTTKSAHVSSAGSAVAECGKLGTPSQFVVVGGVKVEVVSGASHFATATAAGSVARTAVADAAADRPEVRVASFTKVGRVKEMSPRGQQHQQPPPQQQYLTAVPANVSARSLAAADDSPWLCVFCHEVSNFKSLGDLFGPYRIVGASPCSPGAATPGQFCQPPRPVASFATPAVADAVEPVKRGRPSSAAKTSSSSSSASAAAARRSTAGGTSPSAGGGEWRPATEGGGNGRLRTVWYHEDCAVWAPGVNLVGQQLVGLDEAVAVGEQSFCTRCKRSGALLGCYCKGCSNKYHYYCAIEDGCTLTEENFSTVCPRHSSRGLTAGSAGVAQAGAATKDAATAEASHTSSDMSGTPKKKPRF